jgi:RNA-binding protein PNO1
VPPHRMTPLKDHWEEIVKVVVDTLKLQIRMNIKRKCVEIRTSKEAIEGATLQKASDYIKAFMLGFDLQDAVAILRLDDLFLDSFDIKEGTCMISEKLAR